MDRNYSFGLFGADTLSSLSARRAWIEIDWAKSLFRYLDVALRKESVDRNMGGETLYMDTRSRSPQGERG